MSAKVGLERTYPLEQFGNIRVFEEISEIPDELYLNQEFRNKLSLLQFVETERKIKKYIQTKRLFEGMSPEEALPIIDQESAKIMEELKNLINSIVEE